MSLPIPGTANIAGLQGWPRRITPPRMKGDLLWVYEGMTQYWGDVLAARSALWTPEIYREKLAWSAARLDVKPGRTWRNLEDTAISSQILRRRQPQLGQLEARAGLLPGRRVAVAGCGHNHPPD